MNTDTVKVDLTEKRNELIQRVEAIKNDFRNGRAADFAEQATENENSDVLKHLQIDAEYELRLINKAIDRIDADEYGICDTCGDDISEQRLEALPYANECIKCAE